MARLAIVALTVVCAALSILLWCTAPAFVLRQPVDASPAAASPSAVAARPSAGPQRVPPPSVLFRAIIEMQKDPATAFTGEQRTRVKGLLREWTKKFKRSKFASTVAARLSLLSRPQRDFLNAEMEAAESSPRRRSAESQDMDRLIALLDERAGSARPMEVDEQSGDAWPYGRAAPATLCAALLRLDSAPQLAFTPEQAAALAPGVKDWKKFLNDMTEQQLKIIKELQPQQRAFLRSMAESEARQPTTGRQISAIDALDALEN